MIRPSTAPLQRGRRPKRPWCLLAAVLVAAAVHADTVAVSIEGLSGAELDNARAFAHINAAAADKEKLSELQIRRLHKSAPDEIQAALRPFGYYAARVDATLAPLEGGRWRATYRVTVGEPILLERLTLTLDGDGKNESALKARLQQFPIAIGARLRQDAYDTFRDALLVQANVLGYLDAHYTSHQVTIDPVRRSGAIDLTLETGPQYHFGDVRFGDASIDRELIERYVPFKSGEPYSNEELLKFAGALQDSGYFQKVDVVPLRAEATDLSIPILVRLEDRKRNSYTAGVGYGTDSGPRGKLGWENHRINESGHNVSIDMQASDLLKSIKAAYRIPIRDPRTDRYEFTAGVVDETTDTSKSLLRQVGAARVVSRGAWRETLGESYQIEDYDVGELNHSVLLISSGSWTRTFSDNPLRPNRGVRLSFTVRGAAHALFSDTSLVQGETSLKWVHSLGDRTRLLTSGTLGATWATSFDSVPASLRYFAGGDQSLRGYGYEQLGPTNEAGDVVGGHNLLLGSIELEQTVWGKWGVAAFVDAGNAFDDFEVKPKESAGVGLRWNSPVGPIRLDIAFPLHDASKDLYRIHFTMGPDL